MTSKAFELARLGNAYSDGALSNRNLIINGGMAIDQRNGGSSIVISGSATYVVDRMSSFMGVSSGVITGQQSTLGNAKSYKITATTGVSSFSGTERVHALIHIIEGQNAFFANGQTVTLSFKVETNWSGNLAVRLGNGDWTRTYIVNAPVTSGVNDVAVSVPLEANTVAANNNTAGLVVEIGTTAEGSLQTSTEGSWIAGGARNLTTSTQWTKTTGNFINVTELQLEVGDTATPFEHRSYGQELALCQRFFYKTPNICYDYPAFHYSTMAITGIPLPVTMRANPTVVDTTTSVYYEQGTSYSYTPATPIGYQHMVGLRGTVGGGTSGYAGTFYPTFTADAEL